MNFSGFHKTFLSCKTNKQPKQDEGSQVAATSFFFNQIVHLLQVTLHVTPLLTIF